MTADFMKNLGSAAFRHRLGDEVTDPVGMQRIAPKHLNVLGLIDEMRLMIEHDRHQPVRILERDEATRPRSIARKRFHLIEKPLITTGCRKR